MSFYLNRDLFGKSEQFVVTDIVKSAPHKYLRKYQRGGRWIYVYHEGEQHGRQIPEEALKHLKALVEEHNDPHAKALLETMQAHSEEKLKLLRELADGGDKDAHGHLKTLGIDRKKEKLEEQVIPAQIVKKDPIDENLNPENLRRAIDAVKKEIDEARDHLLRHNTSAIGVKLLPELQSGRLQNMVVSAKTPREILDATAKIAEKLEKLQGDTPASRPGEDKTYGNNIYNRVLGELKRGNIITADYAAHHKRTARQEETKHIGVKEIAAAAEAKRVAREKRERRELAEIHGSMAHHLSSLVNGGLSIEKIKEVHKALKSIFGKDMRKEDWPYDFSEQGLKVKIKHLDVRDSYVGFTFAAYDADGNNIIDESGLGWSRRWYKEDGRPHIYNATLGVSKEFRNRYRLGALVNSSQRKLMLDHTTNGFVTVSAASTVGGYNWANNGFRFKSRSQLTDMRTSFQTFLANKGIRLSAEDMDQFKDPCHFAAFDDGRTYEIRNIGEPLSLTESQKTSGFLDGEGGSHRLTAQEIRDGESSRLVCALGKSFLLGRSWSGIWEVSDDERSIPDKYAKLYNNKQTKKQSFHVLGDKFHNLSARVRSGVSSGAPVPAPADIPPNVRYAMHRLGVNQGQRISRLTERRMNHIARLSEAEYVKFRQLVPLTRTQRIAVTRRRAELAGGSSGG